MDSNARHMEEGDRGRRGPDTQILQDLISDMADTASDLEVAAEALAVGRDELHGVGGVMETRLKAVEDAVADIGGADGLLVRVNALETHNESKKNSNSNHIALVAVLIALVSMLLNLMSKLAGGG